MAAKERRRRRRGQPGRARVVGSSRRLWGWAGTAVIGVAIVIGSARLFYCSNRSEKVPATAPDQPSSQPDVERLRARVVRRHPHRPDAFTQGLVWHDGLLYESTGRQGQSSLRLVELETGQVIRQRDNDPRLFGEGLALVGDLLYQLTWRDGRALVFKSTDFAPVREHSYEGEGWGLCFDGTSLVMSDGSDALVFRDPTTFGETRAVSVTLEGEPLRWINELECASGAVWANVWKREVIVRIDPRDGRVTALVDASGLLSAEERARTDVLNGIAWMPQSGHFLLTGKLWPWVFEVVFEQANPASTR